MEYKRKTINSIAKKYKVKPEWLWSYLKAYYNYHDLGEPFYSNPLANDVLLHIELAFGSIALINGHINPLVFNNNTQLAKLFGCSRKTFVKMLISNENTKNNIKQIQPNRYKYLPWEVGFIIEELGLY